MANSIASAPSVLASGVIAALANKLPMLSGFSTVFTSSIQGAGKTIQVPLIGTSTATEFSTGGYLTQDDATVTSTSVTLKHFKVNNLDCNFRPRLWAVYYRGFVHCGESPVSDRRVETIRSLLGRKIWGIRTVLTTTHSEY